MKNIVLETKLVSEITGSFLVPTYQRGYRWGKEEVERLLDDILSNGKNSYSLQPIVVKKTNSEYELIDGQQRLTTIYLIYLYMYKKSGSFIKKAKFTLKYETREDSEEFLKNLDMSKRESNIDYYFMCQAYETISEWFSNQPDETVAMTNINTYFSENVKVIWYEIDEFEDPKALFIRLNSGKIPLTSAELVKAMFLSSASYSQLNPEKREEIAMQWDIIEKELHDEKLWFFLTNNSAKTYQTRIDLILDMVVEKPNNTKDKYYTFFRFDKMKKELTPSYTLVNIWNKIQNSFLILKDWYENHELYHKIGYLIASNTLTLTEIFEISKNKTKKEFLSELNNEITNSIRINVNYGELSYKKDSDKISRLLLLFNIESVRQNGEQTQWFPFEKFKFEKDGKNVWSLEHIHAQNPQWSYDKKIWKEWLESHLISIKSLNNDENLSLIKEIEVAIINENLTENDFNILKEQIIRKLSVGGNTEYVDSISNLALLNAKNNSALSNSTFDVKRNNIIKMDQEGNFIPFCTKMVFLKYYTPSNASQLHFWGQADRIAYIQKINNVLRDYLTETIEIMEDTRNAE